MELLRRVIGMRLHRVAARRYPGYPAYNKVIATFASNLSIQIDLTNKTVGPKFEIFVARARIVEPLSNWTEWDWFELGDFIIENVFVLRRVEWIEHASKASYPTLGQYPIEQRFGALEDGTQGHQAVVVDSGFCFASTWGAELSLEADTFPLVLQLRYDVTPSPLPQASRIAVERNPPPRTNSPVGDR